MDDVLCGRSLRNRYDFERQIVKLAGKLWNSVGIGMSCGAKRIKSGKGSCHSAARAAPLARHTHNSDDDASDDGCVVSRIEYL